MLKMLKMLKVLIEHLAPLMLAAKSFVSLKVLKMVKMLKVLVEHLAPWMACCCSADSRRGPAPSTGSDDHRHSVIWGELPLLLGCCLYRCDSGWFPD